MEKAHMLVLTNGFPDELFSRCPKRLERGLIRENDYSPVPPVPPVPPLYLWWNITLLLICFLERICFFATLVCTWLSFNSPHHSPASSAPVVSSSHSWIHFRSWSWSLLDFLVCSEPFYTSIELLVEVLDGLTHVKQLPSKPVSLPLENLERCFEQLVGLIQENMRKHISFSNWLLYLKTNQVLSLVIGCFHLLDIGRATHIQNMHQ